MWAEAAQAVRNARSPVSFTGAGLSAESGIQTFRAQEGLWSKVDPTKYASQEGFLADPQGVIAWYNDRRRTIAGASPNRAHLALARHPTMTHVTQNVDNLLERAGSSRVVHLHGVIDRDRCNGLCGHSEAVTLHAPPPLRLCPRCGMRMRPDVVWYGEDLPGDAWQAAQQAVVTADVMLVAGTSATVWPAAGLIETARYSNTTIVLVNLEPTPASKSADIELIGPAGEIIPALLEETDPDGSTGRTDRR